MIIPLTQVVALIPRVRPFGSPRDKELYCCEVCLGESCGPKIQCPYCGRYTANGCWSRTWGCCDICERIIEEAIDSGNVGSVVPPQLPPFPSLGPGRM